MSQSGEIYRDVWCILGLPFDAVDMPETVTIVKKAIENNKPCFISTPNLNFLISALDDVPFRNSVIFSELSIADGMPLIWIAKFLGIPLRKRVSGSDLIDELRVAKKDVKKIKVFFFGGIAGVAEKSCSIINNENSQLECVGSLNPGFGSLDMMSTHDVLEKINKCEADFLIVSLGAKKGQAWITRNQGRLNAPIISHLGAVVNFIAGNVSRAPLWMQKIGLEWLWRIYQEPTLFRRYVSDGIKFLWLVLSRVIPYKLYLLTYARKCYSDKCIVRSEIKNDVFDIRLQGSLTHEKITDLRDTIYQVKPFKYDIRIDMDEVSYLDSSFLGLLMTLYKLTSVNECKLILFNVPKKLKRIFYYNNAEFLLNIN